MQENLLELFRSHPGLALLISILASIAVAVVGLLPSFFITAANILFFGFWQGTLISFAGESIGAGLAFLLYRRGLKKRVNDKLDKYPRLKRLAAAESGDAFLLVLLLRVVPFVPSGLVTFAAAVGRIAFAAFFIASSAGKIPALLMEAGSVYGILHVSWKAQAAIAVVAIFAAIIVARHMKSKS